MTHLRLATSKVAKRISSYFTMATYTVEIQTEACVFTGAVACSEMVNVELVWSRSMIRLWVSLEHILMNPKKATRTTMPMSHTRKLWKLCRHWISKHEQNPNKISSFIDEFLKLTPILHVAKSFWPVTKLIYIIITFDSLHSSRRRRRVHCTVLTNNSRQDSTFVSRTTIRIWEGRKRAS